MTFDSMDALKNYILLKSRTGIILAQEKVYQIIDRFVKQYYAEYNPVMYERTYQLYRSLVKTNVKQVGNGWVAEVYFDIDRLDYYMKTLHGVSYPNKGYSAEATLESAAHGSHGGKIPGTAIWDEPLKILSVEGYNMLKQALVSAGIPLQ